MPDQYRPSGKVPHYLANIVQVVAKVQGAQVVTARTLAVAAQRQRVCGIARGGKPGQDVHFPAPGVAVRAVHEQQGWVLVAAVGTRQNVANFEGIWHGGEG